MSLATIVVEEHTRATMQLGNDNPLGTVNYEGTGFRHQRNLAHVDFLLFDILDCLGRGFLIIKNQTNLYPQGN